VCWGLTSQHTSCGYTRVSIKETSEDTAESRCTKKGCIVTLETLKLFLRTSSTNTYGTSQMEKLVAGPWKGKPVIKYSRQHGCTIYMIQNKHSIVHPCNSKMAILLLKWHKPEEQEKWIFVLRRKRTLSQINLLPMGHGSAFYECWFKFQAVLCEDFWGPLNSSNQKPKPIYTYTNQKEFLSNFRKQK